MAAKRTNRRVTQLRELLSVLRGNGVTRYEAEGMKLELALSQPSAKGDDAGDPYENLTREQIENWSVPEEPANGPQ